MTEYILGITKQKPYKSKRLQLFSDMQAAGHTCTDYMGIYADTEAAARKKFTDYSKRGFKPKNK